MSDIQNTKEKMTEEYEAKLVQDIMAMNLDGIETETAEVNKAFSKLALIFHWLRMLDFIGAFLEYRHSFCKVR